jgi:hypothetical protein
MTTHATTRPVYAAYAAYAALAASARRRGLVLLVAASACALAPSCATTGAAGEGDRNLPTAGVGPFRKLAVDEVPGIAPFVLDDRTAAYREPAVLAADPSDGSAASDGTDAPESAGQAVILFAVGRQAPGTDVIVRTRAGDGRAFFGTSGDFGKTPPVVLAPSLPWEGAALAGPFALRVGAEVLLYYAAAGGIGLARSTDGGLVFRKEPGPVLERDPTSPWETTQVRAPSVYLLPDGRLRMLYASGVSIGEAESVDGVHFQRVDPDRATPVIEPVLQPSAPAAAGSLLPNERGPFDTARVSDPCAVTRITPAGRFHVRVLYTGVDTAGVSSIGFAGRYGEDGGLLVRNAAPVYSIGAKEAAPALLEVAGGSYLYVQQDRRIDERLTYSAIAGAFAPGTVKLPAPLPFPDAP